MRAGNLSVLNGHFGRDSSGTSEVWERAPGHLGCDLSTNRRDMPAKVLVIAAQPAIQLQISNMLRRDGHDIVTAPDANEGLRRSAADRPDLISIDDDLPGPSGMEPSGAFGVQSRPGRTPPSCYWAARQTSRRRCAHCALARTTTWVSRYTRRSCRRALADCWRASPSHSRPPVPRHSGVCTPTTAQRAASARRRSPSTRQSTALGHYTVRSSRQS